MSNDKGFIEERLERLEHEVSQLRAMTPNKREAYRRMKHSIGEFLRQTEEIKEANISIATTRQFFTTTLSDVIALEKADAE